MSEQDCTFEAGFLVRGHVRRELERAKWLGWIEGYVELKRLLESEFLIRKPSASVVRWLSALEQD